MNEKQKQAIRAWANEVLDILRSLSIERAQDDAERSRVREAVLDYSARLDALLEGPAHE